MPPLIRRSQSAVPRHAGEDGGHSGIGSQRRPDMAPARHSARPVTATIGNRTRSGGRSDAHPLPPRQVPGSLAGAAASTVFMLAPRCTGRSRSWPFPMGCTRVWAGVVKTLASELGPARPRSTGCCPSGSPPIGSVNLTPSAAIPMRCVPGSFCYQLAWRSVPPVRRAGATLSRNPGE